MADVNSVITKIKGPGTGSEVIGKALGKLKGGKDKASIPNSEKQLGAK